jgi:hypothetical protein
LMIFQIHSVGLKLSLLPGIIGGPSICSLWINF